MVRNRSLLFLAKFTFAVAIELAIAACFAPVRAQFEPPDRGAPLTADGGAARFSPPDRGAPETTDGGATRRVECIHITPLMPTDDRQVYFGLTSNAQPDLYWYINSAKAGLEDAQIVIERDTADGFIETVRVVEVTLPENLSDGPQILHLDWSPEDGSLEAGTSYRWYLEVQCNLSNPNDPTSLVSYSGWIERTEPQPELEAQLAAANDPVERASIYGEAGLWFDYMNQLIETGNAWNYLLKGFRLISEDSTATAAAPVNPSTSAVTFLGVEDRSHEGTPDEANHTSENDTSEDSATTVR